jgi:hypothetical protein
VHDMNDKRSCPDFTSNIVLSETDSNVLWIVYNPSLQTKDLVSLTFPSPNVIVNTWDSKLKDFVSLEYEVHCNFDGN